MRMGLRLLVAVAVLFAMGLAGLAVVLPRLADSDQVRGLIETASTEALGRPLRYGDLSVGILPPRIELSSPNIPGSSPGAPALLAAKSVSLRIALLPLLGLTVLVDSLQIDGLEIEVSRTESGLDLPKLDEPVDTVPNEPSTPEDSGSVALAIRSVVVRDARITLIDRTLSPPQTWSLESIQVDLRGSDPAAPIEIAARAGLGSGGSISIDGTSTLEGVLDLTLVLREIDLAPAAVYMGDDTRLDALLSGEIAVVGPADAPESLKIDLTLRADPVAFGATVVEGPLALEASLHGDLAAPSGRFSLDATPVRMASGDSFLKSPGIPAGVSGTFLQDETGVLELKLERIALASMLANGTVAVGDTVDFSIDADSFELAGLVSLLPAAQDAGVSGTLSIQGFGARLEPLSLAGVIRFESVQIEFPGGGRVDLTGKILGKGDGIDLAELDLAVGGQHVSISGSARELMGDLPFELRLASVGVLRANAGLTGIAPDLADTLYGPMTLSGVVSGRAGSSSDDTELVDSLVGSLDMKLGRSVGKGDEGGRLVGFSALGSVVNGLEEVGELARLTTLLLGGRPPDLSAFTSEDFESLDAKFRIHDGVLETERAGIVYRNHGVILTGTIDLADFGLDMTGEIQLGSAVVAAMGAEARDGEIVVPLAHVGGTLAAPDVSVSKQAVTALGAQLVTRSPEVKAAFDEVEKVVPGAGEILGRGLGGLLGGGSK